MYLIYWENIPFEYCSDVLYLRFIYILHAFQGTGDPSHAKQQEERMQAMEEAKHSILAQVLSQDARARCNISVTLYY